jgi:hypothetical protein
MIGGFTAMQHHEMQEEDDYKASRKERGSEGQGPIQSHLKEQKSMRN